MSDKEKLSLDDLQLSKQLGEALRTRRKQLGRTIVQIAEKTALSVSFISQVERGRSTPSFVSFYKIASALDSSMDELIKMPRQHKTFTKRGDRQKFNLGDPDRNYENLAPGFPKGTINACIIYAPAGYATEKFNHEGEEFVYQIKGNVKHIIEDEEYIVGPGDTLHFDSNRTHSSIIGDEDSIELWVGTMPIFSTKEE
jgi:transcriptional regulator with XRE-family HTH domain